MARPRKQPMSVEEFEAKHLRGLDPEMVTATVDRVIAAQTTPSCALCVHRGHNGSYAECHRYPPPFAILRDGDWCGEFKAKA